MNGVIRVWVDNAGASREWCPERVMLSVAGTQIVVRDVAEARALRDALTLLLTGIEA